MLVPTVAQVTICAGCRPGSAPSSPISPDRRPTRPTIVSEVGMLFGGVPPAGVNERLLVRLIVSDCPQRWSVP